MTPEDLNNEIKLIFARACAEGLKNEARAILEIDDHDQKKGAARNFADAFSSAFSFVCERFTEGQKLDGLPPDSSSRTSQLNSTRAIAPQSGEEKSCPVPGDSPARKPTAPGSGR